MDYEFKISDLSLRTNKNFLRSELDPQANFKEFLRALKEIASLCYVFQSIFVNIKFGSKNVCSRFSLIAG
jgi:hypothetical protein